MADHKQQGDRVFILRESLVASNISLYAKFKVEFNYMAVRASAASADTVFTF